MAEHSEAKPKGGQRGGGRPAIDSKTRAKVRKLARDGLSQNAIAKKVGIAGSTVSRICSTARPPILFDRSKMKVAIEAHTVDLKARRVELSQLLVQDAFDLRLKAWSKKQVVILTPEMADKGLEPIEFEVDREGKEVQSYFTSLGIVLDKHLVLTRHDSDDRDLNAVDAWIAHVQGSAPEVPEEWK